jgi:DNA-binding transcriptional ArsR family regulator
MPERKIVTKEIARLLGILAHPHRVQIIEELRTGEMDVNALQATLGISHSGVSQHLALLRAHHVVVERREGRYVFYHLRQPELAEWLMQALDFLPSENRETEEIHSAVERIRVLWSSTKSSPQA